MFQTLVRNSKGAMISLERAKWVMAFKVLRTIPPNLEPQ